MPLVATNSKPNLDNSVGNFWESISEDELLQVQFTTTEPELLVGVSEAPPPSGEARVEFQYDLHGRPQGKAICAHAGCRYPNHFRGFVVKHTDGSRRLVGKDCAHKLYGADFRILEASFAAARELAGYLRRQRRIVVAAADFFTELDRLEECTAGREYERLRHLVEHVFPEPLFTMLCDLAWRKGPLIITERIRDMAAEQRSAAAEAPFAEHLVTLTRKERKKFRQQRGLRGGEIYAHRERTMGDLKGATLFLRRRPPNVIIADTAGELRNLVAAIQIPGRRSLKAHAASQKRLGELLGKLENEITRLREATAFFEPANLQMLVTWAQHHLPGTKFSYGEGFIQREDQDHGPWRVWLGGNYQVPSDEFVGRFRSEISSVGITPAASDS